MKKFLLILIAVSSFFSPGYSQETSLPYKIKEIGGDEKDKYQSIIGSDESGFYAVRSRIAGIRSQDVQVGANADVFIEHFDHDLNLVKSLPLEGYVFNAQGSKNRNLEFLFFDSDRTKIVLGFSTHQEFTSKLYFAELNFNSGEISDERLVYTEKGIDRRGSFVFVKSKSEGIFGIYSLLPNPNQKFETSLFTAIVDRTFEVIKSNQVILPFGSLDPSIIPFVMVQSSGRTFSSDPLAKPTNNSLLLDQAGNFNFLIRSKVKNAKQNDLKSYYYHVFRISDVDGEFQESVLGGADEKYLSDVFIHEDGAGKLICVGSYLDDNNLASPIAKGLAVYTIDPRSFGDPSYSFIPFTPEQIIQLQPVKDQYIYKVAKRLYSKRRMATGAPAFSIRSSRQDDDGNITLFSETSLVRSVSGVSVETGGDMQVMNLVNSKHITFDKVPRNFEGQTAFMPSSPVYNKAENMSRIVYLDGNKIEMRLATMNEFGEVKTNFVASLRKTDGFKNSIAQCHWNEETNKVYLFLRKNIITGSKFHLVEIDLTNL